MAISNSYNEKIALAAQKIRQARAILTGGGAGLSAAAGLDYSGPAFQKAFADYIQKYGFKDLYTSSFYEFSSIEEYWARWARHINYVMNQHGSLQLYKDLYELIKNKDYFVITTNVDGQFAKAGFDPLKIFEVQGNYGLMQCARGCHPKVYQNKDIVENIIENTSNFSIPTNLLPHCPFCGAYMDIHVRKNDYFVEDDNWQTASLRYEKFINRNHKLPFVLLELGVGFNTPGIIRYPFETLARHKSNIFLIRMNRDDADYPHTISSNCLIFKEDIDRVLKDIQKNLT